MPDCLVISLLAACKTLARFWIEKEVFFSEKLRVVAEAGKPPGHAA